MRITNCFMIKTTNANNVMLQVKASDKDTCYIASFADEAKATDLTAQAGDRVVKFLDLDVAVKDTTITINGTDFTADKIITLE